MADILLCGANEGIGLALAASLLELGHRVAVLDISLSHIGALSERFGGSLLCFQADASSPDAVKAAANSAAAAFGGLTPRCTTPASARSRPLRNPAPASSILHIM